MLCDEQARILYFNESFSRFTCLKLKKVKGRYLSEVRPDSIVPGVIKAGEEIEGSLLSENGRDYIQDVSPVTEDGRVVGAVVVLTPIENLQSVRTKMDLLERERQMLSARLSKVNGTKVTFQDMVYVSKMEADTIEAAKQAARQDGSILITGESGTGKNVFAQAIHNESSRREGPFVAVNCGMLGKVSLENELFGYEERLPGPQSIYGKAGLLEIAAGGTLFLEDITELDAELQDKLLHVLQEGRLRRMDGGQDIVLDVRIICSSSVNIELYIEEGRFSRALYEKISAAMIHIPPLRERPEDIPVLMDYFLKVNRIRHKRDFTIDPQTRKILQEYTWPDNVRELKNVLASATAFASEGIVTHDMLPQHLLDSVNEKDGRRVTLSERVREIEREEIRKQLRRFGDHTEGKRKAARELGISLATLYNKLGQ